MFGSMLGSMQRQSPWATNSQPSTLFAVNSVGGLSLILRKGLYTAAHIQASTREHARNDK
jgi:hypothetical protein